MVRRNSMDEAELHYAKNWTPSGKKAAAFAMTLPGNSPSGAASKRNVQANTLEEWFDGGMKKKEGHLAGQSKLPVKYSGATSKQVLLSQEDSDVTIWPVRIDLGDPERGKGLRKTRTLYHYMDEESWTKAINIMQTGADDVPRKLVLLLITDCEARRKVDLGNPKGELRLSPLEPAHFKDKESVFQEVLGIKNPTGKDSRGVDINELTDYCLAVRLANINAQKVDGLEGRNVVKISYESVLKECQELAGGKAGVEKEGEEANEEKDEENVGCWRRLLHRFTGYNRKKALKRLGAVEQSAGDKFLNSSQKQAMREWEMERKREQQQKKLAHKVATQLEQKHDRAMNKNVLGEKGKGHQQQAGDDTNGRSPQNKRMSVVGSASEAKNLSKEKKAKDNPLDISECDLEIRKEIISGAQPALSEIKAKGGWKANQRRATLEREMMNA